MLGILGDTKKKKKQPLIDVNPIEAIREFSDDVIGSVKDDVVQKGFSDILKQVADIERKSDKLEGELTQGEEMVLSHSNEAPEAPKRHDIDPGLEYHREMRHFSERNVSLQSREVEAKLEEVLMQIEQLIEESEGLETKLEIIAVSEKPVDPGEYHLNFFDFIIKTIQQARQQIEDSSAWLGALQSKKGQRSYWSMFKKHGTSFGMSNERQVATQSG